jgi:hypothetical protein
MTEINKIKKLSKFSLTHTIKIGSFFHQFIMRLWLVLFSTIAFLIVFYITKTNLIGQLPPLVACIICIIHNIHSLKKDKENTDKNIKHLKETL